MSSKLTDKVALITGANKGIGLEIARQLGAQGITVLIGARDEQRGREAAQKLKAEQIDAHAVQLDVTEQATIDAVASQIENKFGKLDILAMLPLLRKSEAGRIVNMSSGLGSLTQNSDPNWEYAQTKLLAYDSSKTALNAMTIQFAYELKHTPIKVNSADPGYVATEINGNRGVRTVQQGATAPVRLANRSEDGPTGGF